MLSTAPVTQTNLICFYYPYKGLQVNVPPPIAQNNRDGITSANDENTPAAIAQKTHINVDEINFNWSWQGDEDLAWFPEVVFDDGEKTFIGLNVKRVRASKLPVFFVLSANEENEVVNYRYRAPYLVIDQIFNEGVLLRGVGNNQERVLIKQFHN